jgi:hypothetical protein
LLFKHYDTYLGLYLRGIIARSQRLLSKYAVSLNMISADRDKESNRIRDFLKTLGYE